MGYGFLTAHNGSRRESLATRAEKVWAVWAVWAVGFKSLRLHGITRAPSLNVILSKLFSIRQNTTHNNPHSALSLVSIGFFRVQSTPLRAALRRSFRTQKAVAYVTDSFTRGVVFCKRLPYTLSHHQLIGDLTCNINPLTGAISAPL